MDIMILSTPLTIIQDIIILIHIITQDIIILTIVTIIIIPIRRTRFIGARLTVEAAALTLHRPVTGHRLHVLTAVRVVRAAQ